MTSTTSVETNRMELDDAVTDRLKSAVTKRKGRGFSRTDNDGELGLKGISRFDSLEEGDTGHAQRSIEGWAIFIRGLHEEMTEDDLHDQFADFGTIKDLRMPLDHRTGYVKGYAIIEFSAYQEAKNAIDKMNQETLMDSIISCSFAFVRGPTRNSDDKRYHARRS